MLNNGRWTTTVLPGWSWSWSLVLKECQPLLNIVDITHGRRDASHPCRFVSSNGYGLHTIAARCRESWPQFRKCAGDDLPLLPMGKPNIDNEYRFDD